MAEDKETMALCVMRMALEGKHDIYPLSYKTSAAERAKRCREAIEKAKLHRGAK